MTTSTGKFDFYFHLAARLANIDRRGWYPICSKWRPFTHGYNIVLKPLRFALKYLIFAGKWIKPRFPLHCPLSAPLQLTNYYTMSICTPARASLMTGRYVVRYGLQYNVIQPGAPWGLPLEEKVRSPDTCSRMILFLVFRVKFVPSFITECVLVQLPRAGLATILSPVDVPAEISDDHTIPTIKIYGCWSQLLEPIQYSNNSVLYGCYWLRTLRPCLAPCPAMEQTDSLASFSRALG